MVIQVSDEAEFACEQHWYLQAKASISNPTCAIDLDTCLVYGDRIFLFFEVSTILPKMRSRSDQIDPRG